jgi:sugar lactone lactonase YvrE
VHDQLQLNERTSTFPFVWVALSQRCTIAKVNTNSGAILGEYRTISDDASCNESSRTTVGLDGSVWVGHRGPGGATHVGLAELNGCVDRNGNGTIDTSTGYGDVKPWSGVDSAPAAAQDECIVHHVDTDGLGLGDTRHMSIDAKNNLWIGSRAGGTKFIRVNGATGVVETPTPRSFSCGGYGGLIDKAGVIWSASSGSEVLRWDPNAPDSASNPRCVNVNNYGIAVAPDGNIWVTDFGSNVYKITPDGETVLGPFPHGARGSQGLAVAPDGDVWVSSGLNCSSGCTVGHLKPNGTHVGSVPNPTGAGSTGVSVDSAGRIWTANRGSGTATRIDPAGGDVGADGVTRVGAVDLTVDFPAGPGDRPFPSPYNYSDMTGSQLLSSTAPQGTWTVTQDAGAAGASWSRVLWNATLAGSSAARVEARASDTEAGLGAQTFIPVTNGQPFTLKGRFVQVRVTLEGGTGAKPVLHDIRICDVNGCKPVQAGGVLGSQSRSCVSRRNFGIRVRRPAGHAIRKVDVFVNGKRVRVIRGERWRSRVDLRGLPKGRFTVRIVVTTTDGKRFEGKRRYRTCTPAIPPKRAPRL